MIAAIVTVAFSLAAWAGTLLADTLSKNFKPHEEGPVPVVFPRWPFPAAGALIGLVSSLRDPVPLNLVVVGLVLVALAACTACDLRCGMLPDVCTLGPLVLLIGLAAFRHNWVPTVGAAVVAVPFAATALYSGGRGMGWGDVKLAALGGALLGVGGATLAFLFAAIAAFLVAWGTGSLKRPLAFGPYLAVSIAATSALGGSV